MSTPFATEMPLRLESVTHDPFIDDLEPSVPQLRPISGEGAFPRARSSAGIVPPAAWRPHVERQAA